MDAKKIFENVATIGINSLYYISNSSKYIGGTADSLADNYIKKCFNDYNIYALTVTERLDVTYNNIHDSLRSNSLAYLMLNGNSIYGNHHLVCYGCTRLRNTTTGQYATYLKLSDGWGTSPRYIEITTVTSDTFWKVEFE